MEIGEEDLLWAVGEELITREQAEKLWRAFKSRDQERAPKPKFDGVHVAYYLGALIVIGAMGFFMTLGWEAFGGGGIFAIASAYAIVFALLGRKLWRSPSTRVPGGLLVTMCVGMTPLAMYGLERATGLWVGGDPGSYRDFHVYVKSGWLWIEFETILASLIALRFVRFPFLMMPLAFVGWYMSMDLAPLLFGNDYSWSPGVSAAVGFIMLGIGYLVDRRSRDDFAFWLYLFGLMAFWGGLVSMHSDSELRKFLFCLINVALMVISVLLERRTFMVFGGLGVFGYLGYLSWHVFENSVAFPFALSFLGIGIIFAAVKYAKNRSAIDKRVLAAVPAWLRERLPSQRVKS